MCRLILLAPIEFFVAVQDADHLVLAGNDRYQKQTYRNRTYIQLANKVEALSIPVIGGNKKVKYQEIKIDYKQKWKNVHLRGIRSAYGKAPFFEYFFPYFELIYQKDIDNLYRFNFELLTLCLKLMKVKTKVSVAIQEEEYSPCVDLRGIIVAKEPFEQRNIYQPWKYTQLFGLDFVPNLSIIDLLFCEGPMASEIISQSKKKELNNP
ncbi:hypothetical protein DN752_08375 [Echinicola strongylocentroti]|uniref:WbqC family protein n=1 Tax=Echinicola strongylocentroti TaxID=1795355 RepID=A0A2Z4IS21_9BACT|nr:WbqC family protein [Echinicola strongylocentroti]AWW33103.1 hypothetical protein DN752_08375 [Echinicola strongylocentroti]